MFPLSVGSGSLGSSCVLYGVFVGENVCGVRDKGSGDIVTVYLPMLLEVFLSMTLRSVSFFHETFF
jgi:hypothetical protein